MCRLAGSYRILLFVSGRIANGKRAQKKPSGKAQAKSSKVYTTNLRIGNGGGKQGRSNHPPIDDRSPIRKFNIDHLQLSKTNGKNSASID